jgi:hypothetical protein
MCWIWSVTDVVDLHRLLCARGVRRTIIAVVTDPSVARTLLVAFDLPHEPSAFAPARDPPQAELAWDEPA